MTDPDTCTPDEWDAYLQSVDLATMPWDEIDLHRRRIERYTQRLLRESATARAETTRLLDARDQTNTDAEEMSAKCRDLNRQMLEAGDVVLQARRDHPEGGADVEDALALYWRLSEALTLARAELATANLRAIQASIDAR